MAELNLKQITDKLNEEFTSEERRLIFWYDDNAEFSEEIDNIELINAKVLRLEKDNQLYIKYFLEMEDRETSYLVYAPFPKPDIRENHLADTIHYSREFFVDRASLICADLNNERQGIFYNHSELYGGHSAGNQKVCEETAEAAGGLYADIIGGLYKVHKFLYQKPHHKGAAEDWKVQPWVGHLYSLAEHIAAQGSCKDQRKVECERIYGDGVGGCHSYRLALLVGHQAVPQLIGKIVKICYEGGVFFPCCNLKDKQAANYGRDYSNCCRCHSKALCLVPAQSLKGRSNGCSSAVSAIETGREHYAEGVVQPRPYKFKYKEAEETHNTPLQQHTHLGKRPYWSKFFYHLLEWHTWRGEGQCRKDQGNKDCRVCAKIARERKPTRPVRAQSKPKKACNKTWRDKEFLYEFNFYP